MTSAYCGQRGRSAQSSVGVALSLLPSSSRSTGAPPAKSVLGSLGVGLIAISLCRSVWSTAVALSIVGLLFASTRSGIRRTSFPRLEPRRVRSDPKLHPKRGGVPCAAHVDRSRCAQSKSKLATIRSPRRGDCRSIVFFGPISDAQRSTQPTTLRTINVDGGNPSCPKSVLVTNVSGSLGQGVLRILQRLELDIRTVGLSIDGVSAANYFCPTIHHLPYSLTDSSSINVDAVRRICQAEDVELIIPCTDVEALVFSEHFSLLPTLACSPFRTSAIFYDKYITAQKTRRGWLAVRRVLLAFRVP